MANSLAIHVNCYERAKMSAEVNQSRKECDLEKHERREKWRRPLKLKIKFVSWRQNTVGRDIEA